MKIEMINKIKLKTSFDFDAAHRLVGYDGKCLNLHGHRWFVNIEIEGNRKQLDKVGILWDFTNKKMLKNLFDHKTILKNCDENKDLILAVRNCGYGIEDSIYLMKENPTAENICFEILTLLQASNLQLKYKVVVWESPKSSCEVEG